jgi:hypothetical protein
MGDERSLWRWQAYVTGGQTSTQVKVNTVHEGQL